MLSKDVISACVSLTEISQRWLWSEDQPSHTLNFQPEYAEHPRPRRCTTVQQHVLTPPVDPPSQDNLSDPDQVTFFQDFVAGGMAGSASVVIGHPFDTLKVRVQSSNTGMLASLKEFGGISTLFRGMGAPLSAAAAINAVVFSSYGAASKVYDQYFPQNDSSAAPILNHDPWQKAWVCGCFAGLMQCFIICPMEHVKCRLQVQRGKGPADKVFTSSFQAIRVILREHGISRLYQGWWSTFWREVPAFGLYFATYDMVKDSVNTYFSRQAAAMELIDIDASANDTLGMGHTHTWLAAVIAGGMSGCITWAVVYPIDVIKTRIQTAPLTTPRSELRIWKIGSDIVRTHGWRYLFRGFGVTMIRAFPTNATLFPVYELTLLLFKKFQSE